MKKQLEAVKNHLKFYRKILGSLNPFNYGDYSEFPIKLSFNYLNALIFSSMILMLLLFIPAVTTWPATISSEMNKFSQFKVSTNVSTIEPLKFPNENPFLVINAKSNFSSDAPIIIDGSKIYYKLAWNRYNANFTNYSDVKLNKEKYIPVILTILALMIPSLLLGMYLWFLLKFLAVIVVMTTIAFVVTRLVKYDMQFKRILNIAFHASTLTVIASLILIPFAIKTYALEYVPFFIYLIFGIISAGKDSDKKKAKKGYLEVKPW